MGFTSFGITVTGTLHIKQKKPNQDSFCFYDGGDYAVITVCDGHGSEKYIRSRIGAEIAARETTLLMKEFGENNPRLSMTPQKLIKELLERLKRNILFYWRKAVEDYNEKNPIDEKNIYPEVLENNIIAYGTTLLAVVITNDYILCLQIGDGDIVVLCNNGRLFNPIQADKRLLANQTTSMCSDNAIHDFRIYLSFDIPAIVTACTDGISNSYIRYDDFLKLTKDINDELCSNGEEKTRDLLLNGLKRLSKNGSGDDSTLALIKRG